MRACRPPSLHQPPCPFPVPWVLRGDTSQSWLPFCCKRSRTPLTRMGVKITSGPAGHGSECELGMAWDGPPWSLELAPLPQTLGSLVLVLRHFPSPSLGTSFARAWPVGPSLLSSLSVLPWGAQPHSLTADGSVDTVGVNIQPPALPRPLGNHSWSQLEALWLFSRQLTGLHTMDAHLPPAPTIPWKVPFFQRHTRYWMPAAPPPARHQACSPHSQSSMWI